MQLERVIAWIRIVRRRLPPVSSEAVVDIGAPLTVFPEDCWRQFPREVAWLTRLNDARVPPAFRRFGGAAGGSVDFRLGTVSLEFVDHQGGRIGPTNVLAMFAHDNGRMKHVLVGLGGGTLHGRCLELVDDVAKATLSTV
jgi:hypothetical protein